MNILMLLYLKYPDIRVEKEVNTLLADGHKIFVFAANNGFELEQEINGDLCILRPKEISNNYLWKSMRYFFNGLNFCDYWLVEKLGDVVKKYGIDIIHIHDLKLVKSGVKVARKYNLYSIADLHENYPAAIQEYIKDNSIQSLLRKYTVDRYSRWTSYEKEILHKVDVVITVVDEAKKRVVADCMIDEKKVFIVSNTENPESFTRIPIDEKIIEKYEKYFMISYIGGVDQHRGIDTVIRAMPGLINIIPQMKFVIAGGVDDGYERQLKKLAAELGISEYVEFIGKIPFNKVATYMAASKLGVIPQYASEHSNYTVPHKIFQCMSMGLPVIVSDCIPLRRIVTEGQCGIVFKSGNQDDLVNNMKEFYCDFDQKLKIYGENAKKIVERKYNWENDAVVLSGIYNNFYNMLIKRISNEH